MCFSPSHSLEACKIFFFLSVLWNFTMMSIFICCAGLLDWPLKSQKWWPLVLAVFLNYFFNNFFPSVFCFFLLKTLLFGWWISWTISNVPVFPLMVLVCLSFCSPLWEISPSSFSILSAEFFIYTITFLMSFALSLLFSFFVLIAFCFYFTDISLFISLSLLTLVFFPLILEEFISSKLFFLIN